MTVRPGTSKKFWDLEAKRIIVTHILERVKAHNLLLEFRAGLSSTQRALTVLAQHQPHAAPFVMT